MRVCAASASVSSVECSWSLIHRILHQTSPHATGTYSKTLFVSATAKNQVWRVDIALREFTRTIDLSKLSGLLLFFPRHVTNKFFLCSASFWRYSHLLSGSGSLHALSRLRFSRREYTGNKINIRIVASLSHFTLSSLSCYCTRQIKLQSKNWMSRSSTFLSLSSYGCMDSYRHLQIVNASIISLGICG